MTEQEAINILEDCGDCKNLFENECYGDGKCFESKRMAILALEEIQQYRALGTVEELRKAIEKQRAKKPILDAIYRQDYHCPNCEEFICRKKEPKQRYCKYCGQIIDWG